MPLEPHSTSTPARTLSALSLLSLEGKVAFSNWFPRRINSDSTGEDILHAGTACISKLPSVYPRLKSIRFSSVSKLHAVGSVDPLEVRAEAENRVLDATSDSSRVSTETSVLQKPALK